MNKRGQTARTARPAAMAALLLLLITCQPRLALAAEGRTADLVQKQYQLVVAHYHNLDARSEQAAPRQSWLAAAAAFERLYRSHPSHKLAPSCLFMLGRLYRDLYGRFANPLDLGEAIAYQQDVLLLFPQDSLADDALFQLGAIYRHEKNAPEEAARTFARLIAVYPQGDMAAEAARQLAHLKITTTEPEPAPEPPLLQAARKKTDPPPRSRPTEILPLRYWSNNDYTRVVIETSAPAAYQHSVLAPQGNQPRRLYVDLSNCRLGPGMEAAVPIRDGLLRQVRTAQYTPETVRVVLDIESIADYKVFNLQEPFRVVIDAIGQKGAARPVPARPDATFTPPSLPQQLGLGIKKIVLDPGHGGKDPGAIGPNGEKEKDLVLQVALKMAHLLERELGCEVVLTRSRDLYLPLEERTALANTSGGDLFISIHANAAPSANVRGVETYFLDLATNRDAMQVAARENASSTRQLSDLQSILMDLMQNTKVNESAKLAEFVQTNLVNGLSRGYPNVVDLGVKRAPFVVLIGAQMPAVLTEIAFISNPEEVKRLCSARYQEELAAQLVTGVSQYVTDLNLANLKLE